MTDHERTRNFIVRPKEKNRIDDMIELKELGCGDKMCLDIVLKKTDDFISDFKNFIKAGISDHWSYKLCIETNDTELIKKVFELKKTGMYDEHIFNIVQEYDIDEIDRIYTLYVNKFKIKISIEAGYEFRDDEIQNMIKLKKAGFSDEICYKTVSKIE